MSMGPSWDNPFPGNYQPFPGLYGNGALAPGVVSPSLGVTPPEDSFEKQDKKESEEKQHPWYVGFAKEALKTGLTVGASVLGGMFGGVPGAIAAGAAASGLVNAVDQKVSKGKIDWGSVLIDAALGTIPGGVGSAVVRTGEKAIAKFTGKELAEKAAERTLKRAAVEGAADGALMGYVGGTAQEGYQNYKETGHVNLGQASKDGLDSILPGMLGGAFAGSAFTALGRRMQQHREAKAYKASVKEPVPEHLQQLKPPKISQANRLAGTFLLKPSEDPLLYNFRKVDEHVYRGGMPDSGEAFHRLKHEYGVDTIIDLRGLETTEQAHIDYEAAWAEHKGMEHVWIPMDSTKAPTHAQLQCLFTVIERARQSGGKVYVHCKHGIDRTGSAIHAYEVLSGKSQADAYRNMQENGFNWFHARSRPEQQDFALGDDLPDIVHKAHSGAKVGIEAENRLLGHQISKSDYLRISDWLEAGEVTKAENLLFARVPDRVRIFKEPPPKPVKPKQSKAGDQFVKSGTGSTTKTDPVTETETETELGTGTKTDTGSQVTQLPKKLTLSTPKPIGKKKGATHGTGLDDAGDDGLSGKTTGKSGKTGKTGKTSSKTPPVAVGPLTTRELFGPNLTNIRFSQNGGNTCYLLSALDNIFHHPQGQRILNLIRFEKTRNGYNVKFPGQPNSIHVLESELGGRGVISANKGVQVLEQAYLKIPGVRYGEFDRTNNAMQRIFGRRLERAENTIGIGIDESSQMAPLVHDYADLWTATSIVRNRAGHPTGTGVHYYSLRLNPRNPEQVQVVNPYDTGRVSTTYNRIADLENNYQVELNRIRFH